MTNKSRSAEQYRAVASLVAVAAIYAVRRRFPVVVDVILSSGLVAVGTLAIVRRQISIAGKWGSASGPRHTGLSAISWGLLFIIAGIALAAFALTRVHN